MNATSLEHKTVRPGSLAGYSYYHSNRHPDNLASTAFSRPTGSYKFHPRILIAAMVLIVAFITLPHLIKGSAPAATPQVRSLAAAATKTTPTTPTPRAAAVIAPVTTGNHCADNRLDHFVVISVGARHLWACEGSKIVYDTPVITGLQSDPETETPLGSYKINAKQANTTLTGTDGRGSWSDPVSYWMPFLTNKYGTYGFHDATWRSNDAFGSIGPNSSDASHGCVELPLAASAWLYNWVAVGTSLTVKS